jgi:hypothetical protein
MNSLNLKRLCVMATFLRAACFVLSYSISMGGKVFVREVSPLAELE